MQSGIISIFVFGFIVSASLFGQASKPTITFTEKEFDFGTFRESDGVLIHDFHFTNQGKLPLILKDVKASCGCTVPEWTREPVLPGKNGIIRVSFDPSKQSGAFNKTIQVNSNADIPQLVLAVKGVVIPVDRVEDVYKFTVGDIRLQTVYATFGEIYKGKKDTVAIKVYNNSFDKSVSLTFRKVPAHLKIRTIPELIEPQQEGRIELEYLTTQTNDWDYVVDRLEFLINEKAYPNNRISVTANLREDFSGKSAEEMAMAPRVSFDSQLYDFGQIFNDSVVEHNFVLTNTGKSDLHIRKVSASCGCTAVQPARTMIAPGDSTIIKAVFNATGREGNQKKAITVITNDPRRFKSILWINAMVEKQVNTTN